MWTEDNKKSDANHMAWINLIQSNTAHCAKWGLVRVLHWCRIRSSVRPRPLWGLFLSRFEKTEGGGFMKEHSKTEIEKRKLWVWVWEIETFSRSKFSPATGVTPVAGLDLLRWKNFQISKFLQNLQISNSVLLCSAPPSVFSNRERKSPQRGLGRTLERMRHQCNYSAPSRAPT